MVCNIKRISSTLCVLVMIGLATLTVSKCVFAGSPPTSVPAHKHAESKPATRIVIVVAKRGTMIAELNNSVTPKTTAHILALVKRKFYDHLLFHSVIKDFMATTGDQKSRNIDGSKIVNLSDYDVTQKYGLGDGKSGSTVPLEPGLACVRGTLGLLRKPGSIDSGDCQFFINLHDNPSMNVGYAVFGIIVEGQNVMDKLTQGDRIDSIRIQQAPPIAHVAPKVPAKK